MVESWVLQIKTRRSENDNTLSPKIIERIAHSLANRLDTVRVSHWPFAWLIYLPCTMTQCQSHCASNIIQLTSLSFQVSQPSHSWVTAISIFLPWKSKIKAMGGVKVWNHNVSLAFYRLTSLSFYVNQPSHSWDTTFSKFDLENPRSRSWNRWMLKVTTWFSTFYQLTSLSFHVNRPSNSWGMTFSKFDLEYLRSRSWVWWKLKVTKWV